MDKDYWEEYYLQRREINQPSLFAQHVIENYSFKENSSLIELGCGNGRDSVFFSIKGLKVRAVDQVEEEINFLKNKFKGNENLEFVSDDFTKLEFTNYYDVVYSRFTLHSINSIEQHKVLNWAYNQLNKGGLFCIEARGRKNELFKKGKKVANENDAYIYNKHYRRFLEFDILCNELKEIGFNIEYSREEKGFAPFKNTDEVFIRIVSKKY